MEPLQRKAGNIHESTENMLQILLTHYSWAEIHNSVFPLHSSSKSSSPALFQFLLSAAGELTEPGQAGAVLRGLSWAPSGSRSRQSRAHIHVLSRRTPGCLPGCHKLPWRKVLGCTQQSECEHCSGSFCSGTKHWLTLRDPSAARGETPAQFSQSWGLCWQSWPNQENLS